MVDELQACSHHWADPFSGEVQHACVIAANGSQDPSIPGPIPIMITAEWMFEVVRACSRESEHLHRITRLMSSE